MCAMIDNFLAVEALGVSSSESDIAMTVYPFSDCCFGHIMTACLSRLWTCPFGVEKLNDHQRYKDLKGDQSPTIFMSTKG